jgi:hypothetical protein
MSTVSERYEFFGQQGIVFRSWALFGLRTVEASRDVG